MSSATPAYLQLKMKLLVRNVCSLETLQVMKMIRNLQKMSFGFPIDGAKTYICNDFLENTLIFASILIRIYLLISVITLAENSVCKRHASSLEKHDRDAVLLIKIRSFAVSGGGAGLLRRGGAGLSRGKGPAY